MVNAVNYFMKTDDVLTFEKNKHEWNMQYTEFPLFRYKFL